MTQLINIFLYDIGGELSPGEVLNICGSIGEIKEEKISKIYNDYFIKMGMTPVRALIGESTVSVCGLEAEFKSYVKAMTFGAVLVEFCFDFKRGLDFEELKSAVGCTSIMFNENEEPQIQIAEKEFQRFMKAAKGRFRQAYQPPDIVESYWIVVDEKQKNKDEISSILLKENLGNLSSSLIEGIMKNAVSYSKNDRVVVSYKSSYIYSEEYPEDFINIIELSRIQLFELNIYDTLLDREIGRTYSMLETILLTPGILRLRFFSMDYKKLSNAALKLMELRIELIDMIKDVMNSMKVTDDVAFAYLYRRVNDEFRIKEWYDSTKAKLEEMEDIYKMVIDRLDMQRTYTVEVLILAVIVLEIVIFVALGIL